MSSRLNTRFSTHRFVFALVRSTHTHKHILINQHSQEPTAIDVLALHCH